MNISTTADTKTELLSTRFFQSIRRNIQSFILLFVVLAIWAHLYHHNPWPLHGSPEYIEPLPPNDRHFLPSHWHGAGDRYGKH